jgi:hypothetical protein
MIRRIIFANCIALFCISLGAAWPQDSAVRTVHVFVALADNQNQGIVPVPAKIGNGQDPEHNLYWGAAAGVKTFFSRSPEWQRISCAKGSKSEVLERCVFKFRAANVYLVADAYNGIEIRRAILDFLDAAAGDDSETLSLPGAPAVTLPIGGGANLAAYVGHDGLMDFQLPRFPQKKNDTHRDAVVLALPASNTSPIPCGCPAHTHCCGRPV